MRVARPVLQAALGILLLFASIAAASAQDLPSNIPPGLLEQLNRSANPTTTYNPAQPLLSPLDQTRLGNPQQAFPQQPFPQQPFPQQGYPLSGFLPQGFLSPPSKLENDYSRRAGTTLTQYGYDLFRTIVPSTGELQNGAVAENYILSIGDEIIITLQGQVSRSIRTRVDREGRIVIPDLPPIPAAGRSFAEFRDDLEKAVAATFLNTRVFVSVGEVRQISVTVVGEAVNPGIYRMGGFATALDALAMAGGIKKTGSLRRMMLVRGNQSRALDLYPIMMGGGTQPDLSLTDGDRIVIPPIGPTAAVSGEVDRPGIYELADGAQIAGPRLLAFAGAPLRPTGNRFIKLSIDPSGRDVTTEADAVVQLSFHAGDILEVLLRGNLPVGSVRLDGAVRVPGIRSLAAAPDVRRLIGSTDAFAANPYLLFGVVETTDPATRAKRFVPVDLAAIMSGKTDMALRDGDTVIVLGLGDINYIASADVQAVLEGKQPPLLTQRIVTQNPRATLPRALPSETELVPPEAGAFQPGPPGQPPPAQALQLPQANPAAGAGALAQQPLQAQLQSQQQPSFALAAGQTVPQINAQQAQSELLAERSTQICRGLQELAAIAATAQPGRFANALFSATSGQSVVAATVTNIENVFPCPPIYNAYPELLTLAVEYSMTLEGEVTIPGPYPIVPGSPLSSVVTEAGGLTRSVDLARVEATHFGVNNAAGTSTLTREMLKLTPADLERVAVSPGDVVRFNPVFVDRDTGLITLNGEFVTPGSYDIRRGDRLSELIARAGGLTDQAYPYGAVFTRQSIKLQERDAYQKAARQIESSLTTALAHTQTPEQSQAIVATAQQLVTTLQTTQPVGRMVVEADPVVLRVRPQLDPIMQPGDDVFIPKRPSTVTVTGEALNPTSLQFKPGANARDYIKAAGGFTQEAEDDEVFVILPNGEAEPVRTSYWNFSPVQVPPGSTIVIPKNLSPFDLTTFLKDSTQILSQLAISAASLAVLHNNSTR